MKKINKFNIAAILAAGAMIFGLASCDSAADEKEWYPEDPVTYKSFSETGNGAVTAVWDFNSGYAWSNITTAEVMIEGDIEPSSGKGATITAPNMKAKLRTDAQFGQDVVTKALQSSKNSAGSLSSLSNGWWFTLKTDAQTNIVAKVAGAGAAEAARFFAITDAAGTILVSKSNLGSDKAVLFQIQGAPAGEYKVYFNGSAILSLDCRSDSTIARQVGIEGLEVTGFASIDAEDNVGTYALTDADNKKDSYKSAQNENGIFVKATKFGDKVAVKLQDTGNAKDEVTSSCVYTSSDEKVATVDGGKITIVGNGESTIRARMGRFVTDFVVVSESALSSVAISDGSANDNASLSEKTATLLPTQILSLSAKTNEDLDITKTATWKSSDETVAKVSNGLVSTLKAGSAEISVTLKDGAGTEYTDKVTVTVNERTNKVAVVTLLDATGKDFPVAGTTIAWNLDSGRAVLASTSVSDADEVFNKDADNPILKAAGFTVEAPKFDESKITFKSVTTSPKGIVYAQNATASTFGNETQYWTFNVDIKPVEGRKIKLVQIDGNFQTSKYKQLVTVSSGSTKVAESAYEKDVKTIPVTDALEIKTPVTLTFTGTTERASDSDTITIGNVKLYFEDAGEVTSYKATYLHFDAAKTTVADIKMDAEKSGSEGFDAGLTASSIAITQGGSALDVKDVRENSNIDSGFYWYTEAAKKEYAAGDESTKATFTVTPAEAMTLGVLKFKRYDGTSSSQSTAVKLTIGSDDPVTVDTLPGKLCNAEIELYDYEAAAGVTVKVEIVTTFTSEVKDKNSSDGKAIKPSFGDISLSFIK